MSRRKEAGANEGAWSPAPQRGDRRGQLPGTWMAANLGDFCRLGRLVAGIARIAIWVGWEPLKPSKENGRSVRETGGGITRWRLTCGEKLFLRTHLAHDGILTCMTWSLDIGEFSAEVPLARRAQGAPARPGVYVITCGDCVPHIGTSSNLQSRIRSLAGLGNHRGSAKVLCAAYCTRGRPMVRSSRCPLQTHVGGEDIERLRRTPTTS